MLSGIEMGMVEVGNEKIQQTKQHHFGCLMLEKKHVVGITVA